MYPVEIPEFERFKAMNRILRGEVRDYSILLWVQKGETTLVNREDCGNNEEHGNDEEGYSSEDTESDAVEKTDMSMRTVLLQRGRS